MATMETTKNSLENDLALQYLVRPASSTSIHPKALILLHGVGSNEQDLFQLAAHFPDEFTVISPRGPIILGEGRYAWYEVDFSSGKPEINAAQEAQSRQDIQLFITQVKEKYNLTEVYIGGFSQGAIMSYSIGLTYPKDVNGVIAFSGRVLEEIQSSVTKTEDLHHLKIFIAHGLQDGTLPVHYARQAKAFLQNLEVPFTYHEYNMAHQINGEVLKDLAAWLK